MILFFFLKKIICDFFDFVSFFWMVSFSSKEWSGVEPSVRKRLYNRSEDGEFW